MGAGGTPWHDGRVSTIVFVHAHPDDESSQTSGSMARAVAEGHRVAVAYATGGEHGELPAQGLPEGETLVDWRRREAEASAAVLGVQRVAWLGFADSGMTGWAQNSAKESLFVADVDEVARRLAAIFDEEGADIAVGYDWHGGYGHPDHVKVHHVVRRAVDLATRRPRLLESTFNRDIMRSYFVAAREAGVGSDDWNPDSPQDDGNPLGTPEAEIQWQVDVSEYLAQRRASMEAHRSQATDIEAFLAMPPEVFAGFFGREHYLEPGLDGAADGGSGSMRRGWPFGE
jgi:LmbE family N-acetylglucosaminyl deacetylase